MKKHNFLTYCFIFMTTFLSSCDFGPGSKTLGSWDVEMFGPVSQIKLNINYLLMEYNKVNVNLVLLRKILQKNLLFNSYMFDTNILFSISDLVNIILVISQH